MTDVFFVNDTSCVTNWGSQATTKSLRTMITGTGAEIAHTKYTTVLYEYERNNRLPLGSYLPHVLSDVLTAARDLDYRSAYASLQEVDDAIPSAASQFEAYARAAIDGGALAPEIEAIRSSDVVLINVEGYGQGAGRATRAHYFLAYLATEFLDTECVMANVTLDPHDDVLQEMAERVLPKLDDVVFREPLSAEKYAHLCADHRIGADPVFTHEVDTGRDRLIEAYRSGQLDVRPYSTNEFDPDRPYVCVAGNSVLANRVRHREAGYSTIRNDLHIGGYVELCRELLEVCPQIVLVVSSLYDELVLSSVSERLDVYAVGLNTSIDDSIRLLANADAYVGGRYHPTLFAAKGGASIVPISAVSHKIEGAMGLLDVDTPVFDPFELADDAREIADLVDRYRTDTSRFDHLPERVEELSDAAERNVEHLRTR